jgi:hypothetical protein
VNSLLQPKKNLKSHERRCEDYCNSGGAFLHWPSEALAGPSPGAGVADPLVAISLMWLASLFFFTERVNLKVTTTS